MSGINSNSTASYKMVTDLATSRQLYESGLSETTEYEWITDPETGEWCVRGSDFYDLFDGPAYCSGNLRYPAYTEDELKKLIQIACTIAYDPEIQRWACNYQDPVTNEHRLISEPAKLKVYAQLVMIFLRL